MGYSNLTTEPRKQHLEKSKCAVSNLALGLKKETQKFRHNSSYKLKVKQGIEAGQATMQGEGANTSSNVYQVKNSVIARAVDGSRFKLEWYHKNYLDHVYAVSDDDGDLIEHYRYTAFGEVTIYNELGNQVANTQINNQILWNTRRRDEVTGYYMYKFRHYSAELGRWPSRDPIEERGGINLYAFVGNDSVNWWDFLGLDKFKVKYSVTGMSDEGAILGTDFVAKEVGDIRTLFDVTLVSATELKVTDFDILTNQTGNKVVTSIDFDESGEDLFTNQFRPDNDSVNMVDSLEFETGRLSLGAGVKITNNYDCGNGLIGTKIKINYIVSAGTITDSEKTTFGLTLGGEAGGPGGKLTAEGHWGFEQGYTSSNTGFTVTGLLEYKLCPCAGGKKDKWSSTYLSSEGSAILDSNDERHKLVMKNNTAILKTYFSRYQ